MTAAIIAILSILVLILFLVSYFLNEARKKHKENSKKLEATINSMDAYIKEVQKIDSQKDERLEKISTGSDSDKFDNSLNVLSNISASRRKIPGGWIP